MAREEPSIVNDIADAIRDAWNVNGFFDPPLEEILRGYFPLGNESPEPPLPSPPPSKLGDEIRGLTYNCALAYSPTHLWSRAINSAATLADRAEAEWERERDRLLECIARIASNASIPHKVKQICAEVLA